MEGTKQGEDEQDNEHVGRGVLGTSTVGVSGRKGKIGYRENVP